MYSTTIIKMADIKVHVSVLISVGGATARGQQLHTPRALHFPSERPSLGHTGHIETEHADARLQVLAQSPLRRHSRRAQLQNTDVIIATSTTTGLGPQQQRS